MRRRASLAVALAVPSVLFFAGLSYAASTIEAVGSASWSNNTQTIDAGESITFKNSTGLPHGVKWDATVPATPSCGAGVPTGNSSNSANWEGSCSFSQAGEYPFMCSVHANMTGKITVNSAGPGAPIVSTSATGTPSASDDTKASLAGSVNPNGLTTEYWFEYGTSAPTYGTLTTKVPGLTGGNQSVSANLTGLTAATTYHFRLVAKNSSGETQGTDHTFTTFGPPLATTSTATSITAVKATLRGSVNPSGHATTYHFKWGETTSYDHETTAASAGSGTPSTSVSTPLTGLSPGTTYHFLIVATSTSGTDEGDDQMFTTAPPDTTDPQTTIKTKPADPSSSTTAEFTYESSEAGSTFECKMDGESFTVCASTG
jgi:plastocyanin